MRKGPTKVEHLCLIITVKVMSQGFLSNLPDPNLGFDSTTRKRMDKSLKNQMLDRYTRPKGGNLLAKPSASRGP